MNKELERHQVSTRADLATINWRQRAMKTIISTLAIFALSGCITTNPNATIDAMKGSGSLNRLPNGKTEFRYAVSKDAYNDLGLSNNDLIKQHEWLIGSYLASQNACPKGYSITNRSYSKESAAFVYTGTCN